MAAGETSELEIVQDFTLYHNAKNDASKMLFCVRKINK